MMQATQPQQQQCHALQPEDMATDDKLVLAPIIFQGKMILVINSRRGLKPPRILIPTFFFFLLSS